MVGGTTRAGKLERFAAPPWTRGSEEWQIIDGHLPANHLARLVDRAVDRLDLDPLWDSYLGVGKNALRPDLWLKVVLYEMQSKRPSPAQWTKDVRENEPVRWLLFGMEPSRARLYDFRDRLAPFLETWNAQVLQWAVEENMTAAERVALDSTSVAAHASRRQFLNDERLQKRREIVDESLAGVERGEAIPAEPGWLAATPTGLRRQKRHYEHAAQVLCHRQEANAQRRSSKRKPADKVLVSAADPEAALRETRKTCFGRCTPCSCCAISIRR